MLTSTGWRICVAGCLLLTGCVPKSPLRFESPFARCGALGEACCRAPEAVQNVAVFGPLVSCQEGLGCDLASGRCVAPCGGTGQPCCDGPETRALKWTADGRTYSPNSWNMREMCTAGACEKQTHRCFGCGTGDGQPCCPPDAAQATARCVGDRLTCIFDPDSFGESGTCYACGVRGHRPCPWGCDAGLGLRHGLCDVCGGDGQPPCDGGCQAGLAVAQGLCRQCGGNHQIPCDFGCRAGLGLKQGRCEMCNGPGQAPCDSGCSAGTRLSNGVCVACGRDGQPPCANGCVYPLRVAGNLCRSCGAQGQIPCDIGCDQGLIVSGGRCVKPPGTAPGEICATAGEACVADFVAGKHCCRTGGPLLCVYGKCWPCVPHGEECKVGGSWICCSEKDGDSCVLDQASEKVICGIPG